MFQKKYMDKGLSGKMELVQRLFIIRSTGIKMKFATLNKGGMGAK